MKDARNENGEKTLSSPANGQKTILSRRVESSAWVSDSDSAGAAAHHFVNLPLALQLNNGHSIAAGRNGRDTAFKWRPQTQTQRSINILSDSNNWPVLAAHASPRAPSQIAGS